MFRIKEILKNKGIKVGEFANQLDMQQSNLSSIINNRSTPSLDMLQRIADALGVSIVELFDEFMPKPKPKRKDAHFGSFSIDEDDRGLSTFTIDDWAGDYTLKIYDAEIIDREDSPEIAIFTLKGFSDNGEELNHEVMFHKKDMLPLSLFCLNLYQQYVVRQDEMEWSDFMEKFGNYNTNKNNLGLIRHNGKSYEINSISDIEKLLQEIKEGKE